MVLTLLLVEKNHVIHENLIPSVHKVLLEPRSAHHVYTVPGRLPAARAASRR